MVVLLRVFFFIIRRPPISTLTVTLFPYTPLFRSTSSHAVCSPGSMSTRAYVGLRGAAVSDVHACHSRAPKFAAHTSAAGSSTTTYVLVSPSSASRSEEHTSELSH